MWWATLAFKISGHRELWPNYTVCVPGVREVCTEPKKHNCADKHKSVCCFFYPFQEYSYTVIGDRLYSIVSWQAYIFPSPFTCIHPGDPFLKAPNHISRDIGPKRTEKRVCRCSWLIVDAVFEIMERMEKASHCFTVCQWGQGWWFLMWLCFFFAFEIENCRKKLPHLWKKIDLSQVAAAVENMDPKNISLHDSWITAFSYQRILH